MSTFYHTHNSAQIPTTTGHDQLNHSFILMNPNFDSGYPGPHHQEEGVTLYGHPQAGAREFTRPRQGLSLSLLSSSSPSSQQHAPYNNNNGAQLLAHVEEGDVAHSVIMRSKYLKAAQELLEEVVNVGFDRGKNSDSNNKWVPPQPPRKGNGVLSDEKAADGGESVQLSSAERQELQMKKAKLVTMLDEAEQRYRQYHNQMQILIHSFEQVAGVGSAKTYTALALKTISKQFRCLKDAIQVQIKAAGKRLGESGGSGLSSSGKIEVSKLKYIDHQIRQQRALQQLGMMQNHNAWRPQRGLPEPAVSLLRAWLFEHFLHPYPKDSDKIMLAKQTGLTRSQVSNWFINARVRLWKPMIEEMYSQEIKEQEQNSCSEEQKPNSNQSNSANNKEKNTTNTNKNQPNNTLKNKNLIVSSPSSSLPFKGNVLSFSGSMEMEGVSSHGSPKRPRNDEILNCGSTETDLFTQELESYPSLGEMGRYNYTHDGYQPRFFQGNKGISLSLGLPPCENQQLNLATTNHTFLSMSHNIQFHRTNDFGSTNINSPPQHSTPSAYECLDIQNRKGFAAQLLPDFVA